MIQLQLLFDLSEHPAKQHTLSVIFQYRIDGRSHFLKHPVAKTVKAYNINIGRSVPFRMFYDIPLCF